MNAAHANQIVLGVVEALDAASIAYMLVGSFSSNLYGRPRSTQDADFVVQMDAADVAALRQRLGPDFQIDPQMSFETVTATTRYIIRHRSTAFKVELFLLGPDPYDDARFSRRQKVDFAGRSVWVPSPEDVVITKLRWSQAGQRSKDVVDVAGVLAAQSARLDVAYMREWCDRHGTRKLLDELLGKTCG